MKEREERREKDRGGARKARATEAKGNEAKVREGKSEANKSSSVTALFFSSSVLLFLASLFFP